MVDALIKEAFTGNCPTETWYPIIAVHFPLKLVVVSKFLIWGLQLA